MSIERSDNEPRRRIEVHLFYSYASQDEPLRLELEQHLTLMRRQGLLSTYSYLSIMAGEHWYEKSEEALRKAELVLLLLSADFLASNDCFQWQMTRAMERQAAGLCQVIPIVLRPVDWEQAPFGSLAVLPADRQPVTLWPTRDQAWLEVTRGIRAAIDRLQVKRCLDHPPAKPAPAVMLQRTADQQEVRAVFATDVELGRDTGCDFAFRLASKRLSKRHARLLWLPGLGQFAAQDLHSANGTMLDGERLHQLTPLSAGQQVVLADSLTFSCAITARPLPPAAALIYADRTAKELGRYVLVPEGAWRVSGLGLDACSIEIRYTAEGFFLHNPQATPGVAAAQRLTDGMELQLAGQAVRVRLRL